MGYLLYMCRDAENLQFYLWFQDYQRRFYALPQTQQNISPPWNEETLPQAGGPLAADPGPRLSDKTLDQAVKYKISFEKNDSPESLIDRKSAVADPVDQAYAQSGLKWKSCTYACFTVATSPTDTQQSQFSPLEMKSIRSYPIILYRVHLAN